MAKAHHENSSWILIRFEYNIQQANWIPSKNQKIPSSLFRSTWVIKKSAKKAISELYHASREIPYKIKTNDNEREWQDKFRCCFMVGQTEGRDLYRMLPCQTTQRCHKTYRILLNRQLQKPVGSVNSWLFLPLLWVSRKWFLLTRSFGAKSTHRHPRVFPWQRKSSLAAIRTTCFRGHIEYQQQLSALVYRF